MYGRSIGGIAANYLVKRFPEYVKVFIGDRTMGNIESLARNRYPTQKFYMVNLYRVLSCKWYADNGDGFLDNKECYKIHCCDPDDDTVDVFSSHHHEVAARHC